MKPTILLLLLAATSHAQIVYQIGDKSAYIVTQSTYDTSVNLSTTQMDNIMLELLKCDSIAEVSKISDLQLSKYKELTSMQSDQINAANATIKLSEQYNKTLLIDVRTLTAEVEQKSKQIKRNRKAAFAASIVAVVELLLLL